MIRTLAPLRPLLVVIMVLTPMWLGICRSQQRDRERRASQQATADHQRMEAAADLERAVKNSTINQKVHLRLDGPTELNAQP